LLPLTGWQTYALSGHAHQFVSSAETTGPTAAVIPAFLTIAVGDTSVRQVGRTEIDFVSPYVRNLCGLPVALGSCFDQVIRKAIDGSRVAGVVRGLNLPACGRGKQDGKNRS